MADRYNLFGHSGETNAQAFARFSPGPTDITATSNGNRPTALANILNPTLANNGGPTRTHALPAGNPAIDAVMDGTCPPPSTDQRGIKRPQDGNGDSGVACNIGSFERRPRE
ncbi:MAG TPA: choice-of-anchor Q domain-containing protein [Gammaproteobacteria bacterium]|nr:choice-of-anchor Q domain-containing protein [Gammaproteobacteria bacterium]